MRLYYSVMCPYSRKTVISLAEKSIPCELIEEKFWEKSSDLIKIEQTGVLPVLLDNKDGVERVVSWSIAIDDYLESVYPECTLFGDTEEKRLNVKKLLSWFDQKFYAEVVHGIVNEKVVKRFSRTRSCPNSGAIRSGIENMYYHLEYITWMLEYNDWLAGEDFSLADISAAAHLSTLDYLGQVPWHDFLEVKTWYARIKSRPSFRHVLKERISSLLPVEHYANLDF